MKITKSQLKEIIQEEIEKALRGECKPRELSEKCMKKCTANEDCCDSDFCDDGECQPGC